jgi:Cytochrome c
MLCAAFIFILKWGRDPMKIHPITIATCFAGIMLALVCIGWAGTPATPKVPKGWTFTFPEGDARAGKTVFISMKCYSCHAMEIPGEKLSARSKGAGPDLTGYAALPKEYVAESIIKTHTIVAAPGYTVKEGRAAMGEYNHFLTVQELIDLVAFLKQKVKVPNK